MGMMPETGLLRWAPGVETRWEGREGVGVEEAERGTVRGSSDCRSRTWRLGTE